MYQLATYEIRQEFQLNNFLTPPLSTGTLAL